jgi:hypothetical protein
MKDDAIAQLSDQHCQTPSQSQGQSQSQSQGFTNNNNPTIIINPPK